jgi:membrane fusion protein (multidrug efflux system)
MLIVLVWDGFQMAEENKNKNTGSDQAKPDQADQQPHAIKLDDVFDAVNATLARHGLEREATAEIAARTGLPGDARKQQRREEDHPRGKSDEGGKDGKDKSEDKGKENKDDKDEKDKDGKKEGGDEKDGDKGDDKKPMPPEKKRRLIILGVIAGIIVIILGIAFWLYERQFETTDDAFIDGHISQISPQAGGRIATIDVDDNQQVEQGQLLVEIDPRDYQQKLDEAIAQGAQAEAQLQQQKATVEQAEANVEVSEAQAFQADQDLKRFINVDQRAISHQQLDNAIANAKSAHAKLDADRQAVEAANAQVATAAANLQGAQAAISNAKLQLSYCTITAPIAGKITRRTVEIGNVVSPGQPLLAVVSNDLWVTANYKETQLDHMHVNDPVRIRVDSFPDVDFAGHIDSIQKGSGSVFSTLPAENATGNYVKVVQRVPVKIIFDDAGQRDQYPLAPGMSVDPRVTVR